MTTPGPHAEPFPEAAGSERPRTARRSVMAGLLLLAFLLGAGSSFVALRLFDGEGAARTSGSETAKSGVVADRRLPAGAASRQWPAVAIGSGSQATLSTKSDGGALLYRLVISDLPPGGWGFSPGARLVIHFLDEDGFAIAGENLEARNNSRRHDADGNVTGYEWLGAAAIGPETYARVKQWSLSWSGISELALPLDGEGIAPGAIGPAAAAGLDAPSENPPAVEEPPPAASKVADAVASAPAVKDAPAVGLPPESKREAVWMKPANWKKVTKGMSPAQVVLALGLPTKKDSANVIETWYYGPIGVGGYVFFRKVNEAFRVESVSIPRD